VVDLAEGVFVHPVAARQELGAKLLQLRKRAGLSGIRLAELIGTTQSRISRIETARSVPSLDDVRAWAAACDATPDELQQLAGLVRQLATEATSWRILHRLGLAERQREISELENLARAIQVFQPTMIPGLLQVADYARRVMSHGNPSSQSDMAQAVARRLERQTILYDQGKGFEFILTENAIRWRPGPHELMRVQLDRLASMASLPNVQLGIIPLDREALDAYLHPFIIWELEGETLVTVETLSVLVQVHEPEEVAIYQRTLERYRQSAIWSDEAVRWIQTTASKPGSTPTLHG
jgi:transcriptional regulator with XRE-family HTH domain